MEIKTNGKEAKLYANWIGNLEFIANPRPKYTASIRQMIPTKPYFLVVKRDLSTSN